MMAIRILLLFTILFTAFACADDAALQERFSELEEQLQLRNEQLEDLQKQFDQASQSSDSSLVHIVYFKLKPNASQAELIQKIRTLEEIEVLRGLEIGAFKDLGDQRALSDYQLVMQMDFESVKDYQTYQSHPIHQKLKQDLGAFLAGPPATYDYWTQ